MGSERKEKINSDIPTNATPLSDDDLKGLIPGYITTRSELYDAEFRNITFAQNKFLLSKKKFNFSMENLYKLHKEMFGKVWKWAGKKRGTEKNIGVEVYNIESEIKRLIDDLNFWQKKGMDKVEISARLHHRLVFIHPFNNGNGRWARLALNLFLKDNLNSIMNFPENEIFLTGEIRDTYIRALEKADKNNFSKLIEFHNTFIKDFVF